MRRGTYRVFRVEALRRLSVIVGPATDRFPPSFVHVTGVGMWYQGSWKKCMSRRHNPRMMTVRMEELTFGHRQCVKPDQVPSTNCFLYYVDRCTPHRVFMGRLRMQERGQRHFDMHMAVLQGIMDGSCFQFCAFCSCRLLHYRV